MPDGVLFGRSVLHDDGVGRPREDHLDAVLLQSVPTAATDGQYSELVHLRINEAEQMRAEGIEVRRVLLAQKHALLQAAAVVFQCPSHIPQAARVRDVVGNEPEGRHRALKVGGLRQRGLEGRRWER
jgi:hypothetical protein